jgi:hypothetical protein
MALPASAAVIIGVVASLLFVVVGGILGRMSCRETDLGSLFKRTITINPTTGEVLPGVISSVVFLMVCVVLSSSMFFQLSLVSSIKKLYWTVMQSVVTPSLTAYDDNAVLKNYDTQLVNVFEYAQTLNSDQSKLDALDVDSRKQVDYTNSGLFSKCVLLAMALSVVPVLTAKWTIDSLWSHNALTGKMLQTLKA